ncbi:MAG: glycoside hydrolase family 1 protein [Deltaproteobacteria bacterium]
MRAALVTALVSLLAGCSCHLPSTCQLADGGPGCSVDAGPKSYAIDVDAGFLFGTATAAFQVEGGIHGADWWQWTQVPLDGGSCTKILHCDDPDEGPDDYAQFTHDLALAKALGTNAYRFSIEWSRLEPTEGQYDPTAIAHYHALLAACAANGLTPMVTLEHYTLPTWLHGIAAGKSGVADGDWVGGWRGLAGETPGPSARIVQAFGKFAGDMAKEYGGEVDLWISLNEPMALIAGSYIGGQFPPGASVHLTDARNAVVNQAYANAAAYDAIHASDIVAARPGGPAALVGIAKNMPVFLPDPSSDQTQATAAAKQFDYLFNWLFLNAIIDGNLDTHLDGSYSHPGDAQGEGQAIAALAGRADFIGVNYYSTEVVTPISGGIPDTQGSSLVLPGIPQENPDPNVPKSDPPVNEQIYPQGLHDTLMAVSSRFPLLPIYITENGIADAADTKRAAFIVAHVQAMQQAMAEGADVRGYVHWALMDNFEWAYGFTPRYGLYQVDYTSAAKTRTITKGAEAYQAIIAAQGVTPAIAQQWGP